MQVPHRKSEDIRRASETNDRYLSADAVRQLKEDVERMKRTRPRILEELTKAREMGDLSENAAYSDAKRRLTGLDWHMAEVNDRIKNAIIIERGASFDGRAQIGSTVTLETSGKQRRFEITGSQETDPSSGRISHLSPLGSAVIGHRAGETIIVKNAAGKTSEYVIAEVE